MGTDDGKWCSFRGYSNWVLDFAISKSEKNRSKSLQSFEFEELTIDNFRTSPNIKDMMASLSITD